MKFTILLSFSLVLFCNHKVVGQTPNININGPSTVCSSSATNKSFYATVSNGGTNPMYSWLKKGIPVSDRIVGPPHTLLPIRMRSSIGTVYLWSLMRS